MMQMISFYRLKDYVLLKKAYLYKTISTTYKIRQY